MDSRLISLSLPFYSPSALDEAIEEFRTYCSVNRKVADEREIVIEIEPLPAYSEEADRLVDEFLNYLLDASLQERLGLVRP